MVFASGTPFVSIQDAGRTGAVERHLAEGVLVSPQLVAVPGEALWIEDAGADLEILLASTADSDVVVERIKPKRIDVAPPDQAGQPRGALVWLAHDTSLPAPYPRELGDYHDDGVGPLSLDSSADTEERLRAIADWETLHRQNLVRHLDPPDPRIRMWWCFIFGGC